MQTGSIYYPICSQQAESC